MSKLQNLGWNSNKDSATLTNRFWTQNKLPRCHFIQPSSGVHTEGCKVRSVNATQAPLCCDRISLSTWAKELCKWSWRDWAEVAKFQRNQFHPISWVPMGPPIHQLLMTPLHLPRALEAFRVGVAAPAIGATWQDADTTFGHVQRAKMRIHHGSSCNR